MRRVSTQHPVFAQPRVALAARDLTCARGRGANRFSLNIESLDLHAGEVLVILGPNGAGKSTLLRALAGLEETTRPKAIRAAHGPVTLVFQRPAAFSGSVWQNVAAALLGKGIPAQARPERIRHALARFKMDQHAEQKARTLSGGELRRLALARAFVLDPEVLLLDEPFDDLDAESQRDLSADLKSAVTETGIALGIVTHDLRRALLLADRIAVLQNGQLTQQGPSDTLLMHPQSQEIASIVGMTNIAEGTVLRKEGGICWVGIDEEFEVPTMSDLEVGERAWIGIRPEHLKLDTGRGDGHAIGKASVEDLVSDGLATVATLRAGSRILTTHLLSGRGLARRLRPGDIISLAVDPSAVHAKRLTK